MTWQGLLHGVKGVLTSIYGSAVTGSGLHLLAAAYFTLVLVAFVVGAVRSNWERFLAFDSKWSQDEVDRANDGPKSAGFAQKINWRLARMQQAVSLRFSMPFGVIVLLVMYYFIWSSFNFTSYVIIGLVWWAMGPVIRLWWIRTMRRANQHLDKHGLLAASEVRIVCGTGRLFRFYVNWGLAGAGTMERRSFRGRLRLLNPLLMLISWLRMGILKPITMWFMRGLFWLVCLPYMVFELTDRTRSFEASVLKPDWARGYGQLSSDGVFEKIEAPDADPPAETPVDTVNDTSQAELLSDVVDKTPPAEPPADTVDVVGDTSQGELLADIIDEIPSE